MLFESSEAYSQDPNILGSRHIAIPPTLLEIAIVCHFRRFVGSRFQSLTLRGKPGLHQQDLQSNLVSALGDPEYVGRLLYAAATGGDAEIATMLFKYGTTIDTRSRYSSGALARAIYRRNLEVAKVLLDHGALPDAPGTFLIGIETHQRETSDDISMSVHDPSYFLEATPIQLAAFHRDRQALRLLTLYHRTVASDNELAHSFSKERMRYLQFDVLEWLAEWPSEIAIDDFETFVTEDQGIKRISNWASTQYFMNDKQDLDDSSDSDDTLYMGSTKNRVYVVDNKQLPHS